MRKLASIPMIMIILFLTSCSINMDEEQKDHAGQKAEVEKADGEQMERQIWKDFKVGNMEVISAKISDAFQSVHQDGARNKEQELKLLKNVNLGDYELSEFKTSQEDNVLVVTYMISVKETIDGKVLSTDPAPRLSTWIKEDGTWKWISHANLNPLKK